MTSAALPPLAHLRVGPPDAARTAFVLHGILGSGRNLRTLALRLCAAVPDLQCVLPDLRHHGDSQGLPPPDTLAACVDDLERLAAQLGLQPWAVIGHSFGGKVALTWARRAPAGLRQVWVLDATPERVPPDLAAVTTAQMLAPVTGLPMPQRSRQAAVEALQAAGVAASTAQWLSLALRSDEHGGWVWRYHVPGLQALLRDYFDHAFWDLLAAPPAGVTIDLVRALREPRWTPTLLAQLNALPVRVHPLDAGHWLHVDDLEGLLRLLIPSLQGPAH
jgi:pimeloyl-ACP methyl ester carboxylesterase